MAIAYQQVLLMSVLTAPISVLARISFLSIWMWCVNIVMRCGLHGNCLKKITLPSLIWLGWFWRIHKTWECFKPAIWLMCLWISVCGIQSRVLWYPVGIPLTLQQLIKLSLPFFKKVWQSDSETYLFQTCGPLFMAISGQFKGNTRKYNTGAD